MAKAKSKAKTLRRVNKPQKKRYFQNGGDQNGGDQNLEFKESYDYYKRNAEALNKNS